MVGIASELYDLDGHRLFEAMRDGDVSGARRASRTATLDSGTAVYDTGYTDSDREVTAIIEGPSADDVAFARHMVSMYEFCVVSCIDGCFNAVPAEFVVRQNRLELRLLITSRRS